MTVDDARADGRLTYLDRAILMFSTSPYVWFGARELQDQLGFCGWRTRVSEARLALLAHGTIACKRIVTPEGKVLTFYAFQPRDAGASARPANTPARAIPDRRPESQSDLGDFEWG